MDLKGKDQPSPAALTSCTSEALIAIFRMGTVTPHKDRQMICCPNISYRCNCGPGPAYRRSFSRLLYLVKEKSKVWPLGSQLWINSDICSADSRLYMRWSCLSRYPSMPFHLHNPVSGFSLWCFIDLWYFIILVILILENPDTYRSANFLNTKELNIMNTTIDYTALTWTKVVFTAEIFYWILQCTVPIFH